MSLRPRSFRRFRSQSSSFRDARLCWALVLPMVGCEAEPGPSTAQSGGTADDGDGPGGVPTSGSVTGGTSPGGTAGSTGALPGGTTGGGSGATSVGTTGPGGDGTTGVTGAQPPTTTGVDLAPDAGGDFVVSGAWQGYAYVYASPGTTYAPMSFAARAAGEPLCVSGTVAEGNGSVLELGINLNQPSGESGPANVSGAGLALSIVKNIDSPLRAQLVSPGQTGMTFWCSELMGAGPFFMVWNTFNTACWNGSGTNYDPADPLRSVAIVVPGGATPTAFDFCISGYGDGASAADAVLDVR